MDEPGLKTRRDGTVIQRKSAQDTLIGAALIAAAILVLLVLVQMGKAARNPPNPCDGADAETGVSEECQDFIDHEMGGRISIRLPGSVTISVV